MDRCENIVELSYNVQKVSYVDITEKCILGWTGGGGTSVLPVWIFRDLYIAEKERTLVCLSIRLCSSYLPRIVFTGLQE